MKAIKGDYSSPPIFKAGDAVYALIKPELKLIVDHYIDRIYYCKDEISADGSEYAYFERELVPKG